MKGVRRGFTLLEVVFATFLLLFMLLTIMSMFTLSNRSSGTSRNVYLASALAESKLEEVRAWAQTTSAGTPPNFILFGSGLDPYASASGQDPLHPELTWEISGDWETQYTDVAVLQQSARKIRVRVHWTEGSETREVSVVGLVGEPPRAIAAITVEPATAVDLHVGETTTWTATARDAVGKEIPDVTLRWTVLPETATGVLSVNGQTGFVGKSVTFTASPLPPLPPSVVSGRCVARVVGSAGGAQAEAFTPTVTVSP